MLNIDKTLSSAFNIKKRINATKIEVEYDDREGNSQIVELELIPEICSRCSGSGKVLSGSLEGAVISQEEFNEDPEFCEQYHSGFYDKICPDCSGTGCILNIDPELNNNDIKEAIKDEIDYQFQCKREREIGC